MNKKFEKITKTGTLTFFRLTNGNGIKSWYADVPDHDLGNNLMVAGADTFLEMLSQTDEKHQNGDVITANISVVPVNSENLPNADKAFMFQRVKHNKSGATYNVYIKNGAKRRTNMGQAWLCNVTHTVFGDHPYRIYINGYEVKNMTKRYRERITRLYLNPVKQGK